MTQENERKTNCMEKKHNTEWVLYGRAAGIAGNVSRQTLNNSLRLHGVDVAADETKGTRVEYPLHADVIQAQAYGNPRGPHQQVCEGRLITNQRRHCLLPVR